MGGQGSGRRPDPVKKLIGMNQPASTDGGQIYLPNLSGVKHEIAEGTSNFSIDDIPDVDNTNKADNKILKFNAATGNMEYEDDTGGSGASLSVKEDGVQVGDSDIEVLDFLGADFNITESPDKEINITIEDSGIDHDSLTNTHNLTTDIDHDQLTNFVANEHIDWTNTTENLDTSGSVTAGALTIDTNLITTDTTSGFVGIGRTASHHLDVDNDIFARRYLAVGDVTGFDFDNLPGFSAWAVNVAQSDKGFFVRCDPPTGATDGRAFGLLADGDIFASVQFYSDGTYGLGGGSATRDTFLKRDSAGVFLISGGFNGTDSGALKITGELMVAHKEAAQTEVDVSGAITLRNSSEPSTPSSAGALFVSGGELHYIGSSGTTTKIADA